MNLIYIRKIGYEVKDVMSVREKYKVKENIEISKLNSEQIGKIVEKILDSLKSK